MDLKDRSHSSSNVVEEWPSNIAGEQGREREGGRVNFSLPDGGKNCGELITLESSCECNIKNGSKAHQPDR